MYSSNWVLPKTCVRNESPSSTRYDQTFAKIQKSHLIKCYHYFNGQEFTTTCLRRVELDFRSFFEISFPVETTAAKRLKRDVLTLAMFSITHHDTSRHTGINNE